jgi:hypothetical protein
VIISPKVINEMIYDKFRKDKAYSATKLKMLFVPGKQWMVKLLQHRHIVQVMDKRFAAASGRYD